MDTLIRSTGRSCTARQNGTLSGNSCRGFIIEHLTLHSQRVGELIVGGRNRYENWIKAEFYCNHCGIVYRTTDSNRLIHTDHEKVLKVMRNSYAMKISRNVPYNEVLPIIKPGENEKEYFNRLQEDQHLIEFYEERDSSRLMDILADKPEIFLIIKRVNKPVLLDKGGEERKRCKEKIEKVMAKGKNMFDAGKRKAAQEYVNKHIPGAKFDEKTKIGSWPVFAELKVEIEQVVIPKNAVPARLVKILDEELNIQEYWIPADAVKAIDKK